jgi:GH15 family glucan-1,4-alpha-glucosidase
MSRPIAEYALLGDCHSAALVSGDGSIEVVPNCLALAGEVRRAREVFERVIGHANDVGLLAEEIDPRDGSLLGNLPQAFSHVGLITAAWSIEQAIDPEEGTS